MLKRLHDLLYKLISVKGVLVIGTFCLVLFAGLDAVYAFIALAYWSGSRELYKHFIIGKQEK